MRGWTFAALFCAGLFVLQGCATTVTVSDGTSPTPAPTPAPTTATFNMDFVFANFPEDALANMSNSTAAKDAATQAMQASIATMMGSEIVTSDVNITYLCGGNTSNDQNSANTCDTYNLLGSLATRRLEASSSPSQDESVVPDFDASSSPSQDESLVPNFDGRASPRRLVVGQWELTVAAKVVKVMTEAAKDSVNTTVQTAATAGTGGSQVLSSFAADSALATAAGLTNTSDILTASPTLTVSVTSVSTTPAPTPAPTATPTPAPTTAYVCTAADYGNCSNVSGCSNGTNSSDNYSNCTAIWNGTGWVTYSP